MDNKILEEIIAATENLPWTSPLRNLQAFVDIKNGTFKTSNEQREAVTLLLAMILEWKGKYPEVEVRFGFNGGTIVPVMMSDKK